MEPLKEMFNLAYYTKLTSAFCQVYKPFAGKKFMADVLASLDSLSLNERMRHTSIVLHRHLPSDYQKTVALMMEVIPLLPKGYTNLVFPDYVSQFGTAHLKLSLKALAFFTQFGSSEFAIRTFLKTDFEYTLAKMYDWSEDKNEHVRRLSSEGSRPRLPWSFKLDEVIQYPKHTRPILENLKKDESLYVRKSVANHLNDFSKDSPGYVLDLVKQWDLSHPHTGWIVKRGCRSLLKSGDQKAMALFQYTKKVHVWIKNFSLHPSTVAIGQVICFEFDLISRKKTDQQLMVDYRIYYVKKNGSASPKTFKLTEVKLAANAAVHVSKKQRFQDFATRKHFAGQHWLEIIVNGSVLKKVGFRVQ
jgi:3-methyladenine DNA glycosylase AlkC